MWDVIEKNYKLLGDGGVTKKVFEMLFDWIK